MGCKFGIGVQAGSSSEGLVHELVCAFQSERATPPLAETQLSRPRCNSVLSAQNTRNVDRVSTAHGCVHMGVGVLEKSSFEYTHKNNLV